MMIINLVTVKNKEIAHHRVVQLAARGPHPARGAS